MYIFFFLFYRKTDGRKDECIVAQEKMHPACAQRVEGADMPTCHSLAETCKKNEACRQVYVFNDQDNYNHIHFLFEILRSFYFLRKFQLVSSKYRISRFY